MSLAVIAQNRFGQGARPSQSAAYSNSPQQSLLNQLKQSPAVVLSKRLPSSETLLEQWRVYRKDKNSKKMKQQMNLDMAKKGSTQKGRNLTPKKVMTLFAGENFKSQVKSANSLNWRLFDFFSNHFSVSSQGGLMTFMAGSLESEAIANNLLGNFDDMLLAVCRHPAMLLYLNNEKSFGPNSPRAKRQKKKKFGLNENLAREILELHTLGVDGGYKQNDVTELAKAITGWSLSNPKKDKYFGFKYVHQAHEPGSRTVMGKTYPNNKQQGEKILIDLARHPSTAAFMARKLVSHFVADMPNDKLVAEVENTWLNTNGNIKAVMERLINSPLAWQVKQHKFKTPKEYMVSAMRLLEIKPGRNNDIVKWQRQLGQQPYGAGSPAGFPDNENDWNSANALMARIDWVNYLARKNKVNLDGVLPHVFGSDKTSDSYLQVVRAESRKTALSLLLLSPEFMRR